MFVSGKREIRYDFTYPIYYYLLSTTFTYIQTLNCYTLIEKLNYRTAEPSPAPEHEFQF
jgi:hypothetical protein